MRAGELGTNSSEVWESQRHVHSESTLPCSDSKVTPVGLVCKPPVRIPRAEVKGLLTFVP